MLVDAVDSGGGATVVDFLTASDVVVPAGLGDEVKVSIGPVAVRTQADRLVC